jgi:hypothetical protein
MVEITSGRFLRILSVKSFQDSVNLEIIKKTLQIGYSGIFVRDKTLPTRLS